MYLDSSYIAKYYVNEPGATSVRKRIRKADHVCSSAWALVEVTTLFHRHVQDGHLSATQGRELTDLFLKHATDGLWNLAPVNERLLLATAALIRRTPKSIPLRSRDAVHLTTAIDLGEPAIWTSDRHLQSAAVTIGLAAMTA